MNIFRIIRVLEIPNVSGRAPDADSGIEDEDPNSPPSNSPHSNTPSSTTHLKPNGNGHVTLSSHRSLSPSTSYNELLDARTPACLESYSMEGVDQHNLLRRMHGTPPIAHSRELQKIAQNYADYLAEARLAERENMALSPFPPWTKTLLSC